MRKMTAGFLFCDNMVLLVEKTRPDWQTGLLNGVGGGVEASETPYDCMLREFHEETRIDSVARKIDWSLFAIESSFGENKYMVYFYRAFLPPGEQESRSICISVPSTNDSGESLVWVDVRDLLTPMHRVVGNLNWLVPMAMDWRSMVAKIDVIGDIRTRSSW